MTCAKPSDCAPCSKCPETPAPVMPRCDVVLQDGVYTNATVVVEDGCIIEIQQGQPLLYQPEPACGPGAGQGPDTPLDPGQGPPGDNATIEINMVESLPAGSSPYVENVGTATHAILNFGIPRGATGADALPASGATTSAAGIIFTNGLLKTPLPPAWPPVLDVLVNPPTDVGVALSAVKGSDGIVRVTLDLSGLITNFNSQLALLQSQIDALNTASSDHETRISALEAP